MLKSIFFILFNLLLIFFYPSVITAQEGTKQINAHRIEKPPVLDGLPSDSIWQVIESDSGFLQIDPNPGKPATFETVVKVAFTDADLFVLFVCYDPEPSQIVARELKYDGYTSGDDNVKLILDTFGDGRNGYWFATNPLSVRNDALVSGRTYEEFNEDWDVIWDVKSAVHENFWCAEFRIPFSSLKFPDSKNQIWGINFQRGIRRLSEDVIWSGAVNNGNLFDLTRAGKLIGIDDVERGNPIYLLPFVNVGYEDLQTVKNSKFKTGLDLKYGITDAFTLDFTLNTDFAQVETDIAEINLSRFPLFLPEKRDFFLEGNKLFSFDLASENMAYYSRLVGLERGEGVPILAGLKLTGTTGDLEAGLMSVQTEGISFKKPTNYTIARAKYDFLDNSYAGFIFSNVESSDKFNRLGGVDLNFNFNDFMGDQNLIITTRLAGTFDQNNTKNNLAGIIEVNYPNDIINLYTSYGFTEENFNPEAGFLSKAGINEFIFQGDYSPRFKEGVLRRFRTAPLQIRFSHDPAGRIVTFDYNAIPLSFTFTSNDRIDFIFTRQFDRPVEDFKIFKNTIIKKGEYYSNFYGISIVLNPARVFYGQMEISYGDYYGGTRFEFDNETAVSISKNFGFTLGYRFNDIRFFSDQLQTNEIFTRFKYTMNVNMASFLLVQWNNEIEEINLNYKLNVKPSPGSDIYLVVNKILDTKNGLSSKDFAIILKISWMFVL